MTKMTFARPNYTSPVNGDKSVGRDGDGRYCTEAALPGEIKYCSDPIVGYGTGDTAKEARTAAAADLHRKLGDYLDGR